MRRIKAQRASILIVALFILFFLSVIALSLGYSCRLALELTGRYRGRLRSLYIAKAAVATAMAILKQDRQDNTFDHFNDEWWQHFMVADRPRQLTCLNNEGMDVGNYTVIVSDEAARLDINTADKDLLKNLLTGFVGVRAENLADSILAYRDSKASLKKFYTVYELLSVSGIEQRIFWGEDTNENGRLDPWEDDGDRRFPPDDQDGELDLGLKDFVTVYGDGKININTASFTVLMSLPAMTEAVAKKIIEVRLRTPFYTMDDLQKQPFVSEALLVSLARYAKVSSGHFRLAVTAQAKGSSFSRQVLAIVERCGEYPKIIFWRQD